MYEDESEYISEKWDSLTDAIPTYACNEIIKFVQPSKKTMYLQSLSINDEGHVLLGATEMDSVTWSGLFYYYKNIPSHVRDNITFNQTIESGVSELLFLDRNRFVVASDDCKLGLYKINEINDKSYIEQTESRKHESTVLTISYSTMGKKLVTGGLDNSIVIWDMNDFTQSHNFQSAYTYSVTSVAVDHQSASQFAATSIDGEATIWDIRSPKPATSLIKVPCELNTVSWSMSHNPRIAIGTEDGTVILIDLRNSTSALDEQVTCEKGISKLLYNPDPAYANQLACASYDTTVKILDQYLMVMLNDEQHSDFVTGIAWHENDLYSCGWDGHFIKHAKENRTPYENPIRGNPPRENPVHENPAHENPARENPIREDLIHEDLIHENIHENDD